MKRILSLIIFLTCINNANAADSGKSIEMATDSVKLALSEKGIEGKLKISVNGYERGFRLRNEPEIYDVYVNDLLINEKTKFWKGVVSFITKDNKSERFNVSGAFEQLVSVPVLSKSMSFNAVINEDDLVVMEVPDSQVKFDTITDKEKLIGQALKRTIADGIPLKEKDLQKAQIVAKNAVVNITYNTPSISLKTVGIAMESGGEGETIKVKNSSSGKIVQATIKDEQNVEATGQVYNQNRKSPNKTAALN